MIDLSKPLTWDDPDTPEFLAGIQGNIIKSHGRYHTVHLMLEFRAEPALLREWIANFARSEVTSELARHESKLADGDGGLFTMFSLSATGYARLGIAPERRPRAGQILGYDPRDEQYFLAGMKNQAGLHRSYADPPAEEWEPAYRGDIHAMILLAHDDANALERERARVETSLAGAFAVLVCERGDELRASFGGGEPKVIEHFGFRDGISQPRMIDRDVEAERQARGAEHWDPSAPLSLVLAPEPDASDRFGSFMVFRKLEQDVAGFWLALQQMAENFGVDVEQLGAMAVGRARDGRPIVPTANASADPNDFHFDQDPNGVQCPFHAHIRKTNPRGDIRRVLGASEAFERSRRIARRGISYGTREIQNGQPVNRPSTGVGLLFMCVQSNLDQFVIQQEGSDGNDFVREGTGVDAVIGQSATPTPQRWPSDSEREFTIANFVRMKGGEYFYAPSMAFLRGLGQAEQR